MASLNPMYTFDQLPTTSAAAIREFNDRYLAVLGAAKPSGWADTLGELIPTDRPEVTFPISMLRTLYRKTEGESRFKKLGEKSFDVKVQEFDDGYEANLLDLFLKVYAYRNWQQAPARLALAEEQFRHTTMAVVLDGQNTRAVAADQGGLAGTCVDGQAFFSTSHPANMTDPTVTQTFSNYQSTAKNVLGSQAVGNTGTFTTDLLQAEVTSMQTSVLDENGLTYGADPDTLLVPLDYYEPLKNGLANDRILQVVSASSTPVAAGQIDNIYKGRFNVVTSKEFTRASGSTADWYLIDSKMIKAGISPWAMTRMTVPMSLALRVFDESSDYFKNTGNIKLSSHIWYGFNLALPHAIRRIKGPTR